MFPHTPTTYLLDGPKEVDFNLETSLFISFKHSLSDIGRYHMPISPGHSQLLKQSQSRLKQNFGLRPGLNLPESRMASQFPSAVPVKTSCA